MKATLSQLEAFYWIARLHGFRAAAARLNLTQPTVSLRIRGLEQALGLKLFERSGRKTRLTTEGRALVPQAERMIGLLEELNIKRGRNDAWRGRLRLGAPDSFGLVCMPALLGALKKQYPELSLALTIDNSSVLSQRLNDRDLDVALLADPELEPHVAVEPLSTIECAWIASAHLSLPRGVVRPRDLAPYEIFTNPEPSNLMTFVRAWFATAGIEVPHLSTCNSLSVILRLTMAGAGVSLLPTAILPRRRASGSLRVLHTQPRLGRPRLFAAYQLEKSGRRIDAVLSTIRRVITQSNFGSDSVALG